ncbi:MAG: hypothetical protein U0625_12035 [Phycisphaerales bacterium]
MKPAPLASIVCTTALLLAACGESPREGRPAAARGAGAPAAALPAGLVERGPAEGLAVVECKSKAKQGDTVTVVGRIGGSEEPFNAQRAVFTIVDASLPDCNAGKDDHCKTPWDYCCEDPKRLRECSATIEIAGPDGKPLALAVRGMQGLDPSATIAVTGTIVEKNDEGVLVVRAQKIQVR